MSTYSTDIGKQTAKSEHVRETLTLKKYLDYQPNKYFV